MQRLMNNHVEIAFQVKIKCENGNVLYNVSEQCDLEGAVQCILKSAIMMAALIGKNKFETAKPKRRRSNGLKA